MVEPSNFSTAAVNPRVGRRQYLVTYSQADESKFFTQESFGVCWRQSFMLAPVFLKWTIGLVPEMSTRMMDLLSLVAL